jgi:mono/diheme cytochrome c family protein
MPLNGYREEIPLMPRLVRRFPVLALPVWLSLAGAPAAPAAEPPVAETPITFEDHVAGILKKTCATCHGDGKQEGGLSLVSYAGVMKGGGGGEIVVAGRSAASRLIEVITASDNGERMPPDGDRVPAEAVALIRKWIDSGLRENAGSSVAAMRTLGFKPAAPMDAAGPGPVPADLPAVERPATRRAFPLLALAASPRAPVVAAAGYGAIDLVDATTGSALGAIAFPEGEPLAHAVSRSGRLLLAAGGKPVRSGSVVLFDVATGRRLAAVADEPDAIIAADVSPDEQLVAIGCTSRKVKLYATEDGGLRTTIDKHTDWVTAVAFSPDGRYLVTGDRSGAVHLWDGRTGGVILPLSDHTKSVRALSWRSDSGVVASASEDGRVVWWDVKDGWPLVSRPAAHAGGVLDCRFGPTGELATCGRDGLVKIWSAEGNERKTFSIADDTPADAQPPAGVTLLPTRVVLSHDGATVLAGDSAGRLHVWPVR